MKKILIQHQKLLEVLIHIISWSIVFFLPIFVFERESEHFRWNRFLNHSVVYVCFLVIFYINYFILIPQYLFNEKTYRYILTNLFLIAVLALFLHLWQGIGMPPPVKYPSSITTITRRPLPPSRWMFYVRDILGMGFAAALSAIIRISKRWSKIEGARREAEKSRTEAELKNLRNQLNPHFILNTLNNIYALIAFDADKAQQAVQELSKLLRHMLYDNQQTFVLLSKEVDFIKNYIELMRIRLSSHIVVETNITINRNSQTLVAPLIFISLIENAFKHGISPTESSYVYINLFEKEGTITCETINSNYPKNNRDKSGSGIGLTQVNKRLELLYHDRYIWEKGVQKEGKEYLSRLQIKANDN